MNIRDIKPKLLIPSTIIISSAIYLIFTQQTPLVLDRVAYVFGFYHEISYVFWVIVIICGICQYINQNRTISEDRELFKHVLGVATYGVLFNTAIMMIQGIFNQYFYGYIFIADIGNTELIILGLVMCGLLFWSVSEVYKVGVDTYISSGTRSTISTTDGK